MRWMWTWRWFCLSLVAWTLLAFYPAPTFSIIQHLQLEPVLLTGPFVFTYWKPGSVSQKSCLHLPQSSFSLFLCSFHWSCSGWNCRMSFYSPASSAWDVTAIEQLGRGCRVWIPLRSVSQMWAAQGHDTTGLWKDLVQWVITSASVIAVHFKVYKTALGVLSASTDALKWLWLRGCPPSITVTRGQ